MRTFMLTLLLATPAFTLPALSLSAHAQSLCDLLPASAVKATLGISDSLTATPNTDGGNGCDYKIASPGPTLVVADVSNVTEVLGTVFAQRMASGFGTAVPGIGEAAYYRERSHEQIVKYPNKTWTQQTVVFRAKGKIVSFVVVMQGAGVPKANVLALATLALSKPINTLQDPK